MACLAAAWPGAALATGDAGVIPIKPVDTAVDRPLLGDDLAAGGESFTDGEAPLTVPAEAAGAAGDAIALDDQSAQGAALDDVAGRSLPQLRAHLDKLDAERETAQGTLLRLEAVRAAADMRLDGAVAAWSRQLVAVYEAGGGQRLQSLLAVRDAFDDEDRAQLIAALQPSDRAVVAEQEAAAKAAERAAASADTARANVLALGTRIDAVSVAIDGRQPPSADELERRQGKRFSVDADLVFATGPIPGIGYWGAVSGDGMLSGWMGFAGAAVGGIGCTAPDPAMKAIGSIEQGEASWYGPGFHGQTAASGEVYDQKAMTAAHKTLPFGTIVRVYSSTTARCAFVRINDRGPFIDGRIIDLSRAAADQIGMESIAPVQIEVWAAPAAAS